MRRHPLRRNCAEAGAHCGKYAIRALERRGTLFAGYLGTMQANILLVEDEPVARGALSELLTSSGYRVRVAADGAAALAELRSFCADLVLTNLQLPTTDGLELLRGLNRRPAPLRS